MARKIPDEMIRDYCQEMEYELVSINGISFRYKDGEELHGILKQAAVPNRYSPQWRQDKDYWPLTTLPNNAIKAEFESSVQPE